MKDINQLLGQRSENKSASPSWTSKTSTGDSRSWVDPLTPENKERVNMLFARLTTIYGHKFKSAFQSEEEIKVAKREWALSLGHYGEQELVAAVNRCKEEFAWMPSIAEFLSVLREYSDQLGVPTAVQAYEEACLHADRPRQHQWSHPVVYHAGRASDWFRLRTEDKPDIYPYFEEQYRKLCHRLADGEQFEVPSPVALPDHSSGSLASFIKQWAVDKNVSGEQAATLLYYLSKPKGQVRDDLKARADKQAEEWGLSVSLPDSI